MSWVRYPRMASAPEDPAVAVRSQHGSPRWVRVAKRIVKVTLVPLVLAALWTVWDRHASGKAEWTPTIKSFSTAFFFLMWISNVLARAAKSESDEERHALLLAEVRSLGDRLAGLAVGTQQRADQKPEDIAEASIADPTIREMIN